MKQSILLIVVFILLGCTVASKQYLLSVDSKNISKKSPRNIQIGVDKVAVPGYMEESQIATQKAGGEISYRSEIWAVPTPKALTSTLIGALQKKFSNPNVHLFPWDIERERGIRVKVTINRFIYGDGSVYLEATYFIKRIGSKSKRSYIFNTQISSRDDSASIVQSMGIVFGKLVEEIGRKI
ncbi:MAG: hypothetical protein HF962_01740 [Sulfurovum sp.]|nr:hypothetical protein [Sulfurovum sp.]